jgi:hypothetical protein
VSTHLPFAARLLSTLGTAELIVGWFAGHLNGSQAIAQAETPVCVVSALDGR